MHMRKNKSIGGPSSKEFITQLVGLPPIQKAENERYYKDEAGGNQILGVRMADVFRLAKEYSPMDLTEIEKLLDSAYYEVRLGAVSIMDFMARDKSTAGATREALFELYINRHDSINNWDLVDRSAPYVVGGYLFDKDRSILYQLAKSKNVWERRTAIVSTYYFIRQNDLEDTFKIGAILVHDKHDLINKAVGSWIREAGKRDTEKLLAFLDNFAVTMPRVTLRYAIEKLDKKQRDHYLNFLK
jgi:3-methyladenine DNA glycosylase AlkD